MSQWITEQQANTYLSPNPGWDAFTNKKELLTLSSNRLEQLTFKDEPINRVQDRYLDGNSLSKVAGSDDFLLDPQNGNWEYHEELGWARTQTSQDLVIYNKEVAFDMPALATGQYKYTQALTLNQIQSLHSFGGEYGGLIALGIPDGSVGNFTSIETIQATAIVDTDGEQVFNVGGNNRRFNASFAHDGNFVSTRSFEGTPALYFNGTDTVEVINEQLETVENVLPAIVPGQYFAYQFKVIDGLDNTLFLYVEGILVANPTFDVQTGGISNNRLNYGLVTSSGGNKHTYIRVFGATINTENPITIPIRLVAACALLAYEYGKFPPNFVGDKEYLENENDYNRMQDLPINVQAAVEPFLADYESVIDKDGIATTTKRGVEPLTPKEKIKTLEYT